jgi:mevalonate kinase
MKTVARAPGKVILFGEHAVVHGKLGIAGALDLYTRCEIEDSDEFLMENLAKTTATFDEIVKVYEHIARTPLQDKHAEITKMFEKNRNVYQHYMLGRLSKIIDLKPVHVKITTDLRKGMGTSASVFSALIKAVCSHFGKDVSTDELSKLAYEGDILAHGGTPSGIDNNTVIHGGYITFKKSVGPKPLEVRTEIPIVIGDTKTPASTGVTVPMVNRLAEKHEWARQALDNMDKISEKAVEAITKNDLGMIGKLMNENQKELRTLRVSTKELENLISASLDAGALAAKLSGGGGGGIMIALAKDKDSQGGIADAIKDAGGEPIITNIGVEGVSLE